MGSCMHMASCACTALVVVYCCTDPGELCCAVRSCMLPHAAVSPRGLLCCAVLCLTLLLGTPLSICWS
jgi:hypothetical protein